MNIYIETESLSIRFGKIKSLVSIYLNKIDKIENELDDLKTKGHEIQDEIDTLLYDIKNKSKTIKTERQEDEQQKLPPKYPPNMINKDKLPNPPLSPINKMPFPPPPLMPPKKPTDNKNITTIPSFLKQPPIKPEQNEPITNLKSKTLLDLRNDMLNELHRLKEIMGKA